MMKVNGNDDVALWYTTSGIVGHVNSSRMDMDRGETITAPKTIRLPFPLRLQAPDGSSKNRERLKRTQRSRWKLNINQPNSYL
ncbi:hypothetical protein ACVXG7_01690 [Enterobacter hormaechei]